MWFRARGGGVTRAVAVAGVFLCVAGWAQTPTKPRPEVRFDIRPLAVLSGQAGDEAVAAESKVAERRRAGAAVQPGGAGTAALRFNRFGLPKSVVHAEGVTPPGAQGDPLTAARNYLQNQSALFPFSQNELANLRASATSRSGGLTFLTLTQTTNGIPVFGGHVRVVLDSRGAVIQAGVDDVIPGLSVDPNPRLTPAEAARNALRFVNVEAPDGSLAELPAPVEGRRAFAHPGGGSFDPAVVELSVFPMTAVSARLAYRVFASSGQDAYEILMDAADGRLLYAASLSSHAGQARVWRESPIVGPRELVGLPDSWLDPGVTVTKGNNADAYLDWDGDNEPDAADFGNLSGGRAFSADGMFDFPAGEGSTGQDPTEFSASALTNAFYFVNSAHDYFYGLGFDEAAGNFQTNNFGRGGAGNDAVRTHVQDGNVFSSARILNTPEGLAPILELGVDSQGTLFDFNDDRDFAFDGDVVIHEYTHGVTARLVGGPQSIGCLGGVQSGGLSEGLSDYFAISYFDEPVLGEYFTGDTERGIRRSAYDRNTLTYEDLGNDGFQRHNDGEIFAATLWEVRQALGAATTDQLVINALRIAPCGPSMIDLRDAVLDADQAAHSGTHYATLWPIFARRGMGHSASGFDGDFLESTAFNAAFDLPPGEGPPNHNPTVMSRPTELAAVGQQYAYSVRAADPDGDPLSFELLEGPPGMAIDDAGRMTVTPKSLVPPRAKVAVTDGKGGRVVHGFSVPVFPVLSAGRSMVIDGPAFQEGFAGFFVAPNTALVQFTLRGGAGDADLAVLGPDMSLLESFRLGADETITIADPAPGPWLIQVFSFDGFSGVRLAASYPKASELAANTRRNGLQGPEGSETFYQFAVPEGADSFTVSTGNGSGDVDLYLAHERYPVCQFSFFVTTECDFDESSGAVGPFEAITIGEPASAPLGMKSTGGGSARRVRLRAGEPVTVPAAPGAWFANLSGFEAYEGVTLTLTIDAEGSVAPAIGAGGVVHAASYEPVIAPGGIASLFGSNLASVTEQAASLPLPRELGGVRVLVGGVEAPLFFVSPEQINFQTPFEAPLGIAGVSVERDGVPSATAATFVVGNAPGIFTYQAAPEIAAPVVVHADGSVVSPDNPARAGETVVIYATGISALTNPPASGEPSPSDPLATTIGVPVVTVGNMAATVGFSGLTPNLVGLLQINVQLPDPLPGTGGLELIVRFGSAASKRMLLAVE